MRSSENKVLYLALLLALVSGVLLPLHAENIRGNVAGVLDENNDLVSFHLENIVIIRPGDIPEMQEGMELLIQIPHALHQFQNSFALLIYRELSPPPEINTISYTGSRAYMRLLPLRESTYIRIPFIDEHEISGGALTDVLPIAISADQFPLILTVTPIVKGIPDSAFREKLTIKTLPLWKNQGVLTVNIENPSDNPDEEIAATVNGEPLILGQGVSLPAGIHRISVTSTHAPTVEKTIAIEPGEEISLDFTLDYRPPKLTISVPTGASLFLDGKAVEGEGAIWVIETEPGTHVVAFILGDVKIDRSFIVLPGSHVKIDLLVDINILEFDENTGGEYSIGAE